MSTSGLIAAKKRIENAVKKYDIPTDSKPTFVDSCKNGAILLSLLQSRLNWTNSVFARYKMDPVQQPKRTTASRKKWPQMRCLGTCDLELGAHLFEQTIFYEAIRTESWEAIAKKEGLLEKDATETQEDTLMYRDIVFELRELPNERFIFPKDTIVDSMPLNTDAYVMHASFVIPIDVDTSEDFFMSSKDKIMKYGHLSQLACIKQYLESNPAPVKEPTRQSLYEPINIRLTNANQITVDTITNFVNLPSQVKKDMKEKSKLFPKRSYIKISLPQEDAQSIEMQDLVRKASNIPDIATGPIQAEKKRNEILNAIKLGKRQRDEKFEAELPKYKQTNAKEDGSHKCAYCSTRTTVMWRAGPGGHGTLCNSCGIQWKRGDILKDAPVISIEEERKQAAERREKEKAAEALEFDKSEKENKKYKKSDRHHMSFGSESLGVFAVKLLQQRTREGRYSMPPSLATPITYTPTHVEPIPSVKKIASNNPKPIAAMGSSQGPEPSLPSLTPPLPPPPPSQMPQTLQPSPTPPPQAAVSSQDQSKPPPPPLSLYNPKGIPLPTLSIDFVGHMQFSHPNCGITLLDSHFSMRLSQEGHEQTLIEIEKKDLMNADFEVVTEGEKPVVREVLRMKVMPEDTKSITTFNQTIPISKEHPIQIRFLEKLDPSGGAVVKRILQRWLVTVPQQ
ncbi:uncharacterized protein B0P05DRAFT_568982 [Gilbertella persicaria]|uniref:uncharacterized protein n=1 Tax=Gilbertella persicaria TaxID=101096 RepID=UPI00221E8326|nr:uncharacterized protein B0P05DRAFT_568982 [Gilbertella persicaria]KAI8091039.1 hypothetical protein B0P05DRAFT_568982 [Gilbertella persicaria]